MRTRHSRLLAIAAAVAATTVALVGCSGPANPFVPGLVVTVAPSASTSPTVEPSQYDGPFADYYNQMVDWRACEGEFECATISAPLDWEDESNEESIGLAVVRKLATGPESAHLGSVFYNPGGPGGSGYDMLVDSYWYFASDDIQYAYDLVSWDPRGVSRSSGIVCYTDPQDIEDFWYGIPEADPFTDPDGWVAEQAEVGEEYAAACTEQMGDVLGYIDTLSTARDLDLLRHLVGDEQLHYVGYSYGTAIGAVYIGEFPENVGRIVLDGVSDRTTPQLEDLVAQEAGFELAFSNFLEACPTTFDDCPFTSDLAASKARVNALINSLARNPQPASDPSDDRFISDGVVSTAISASLYSEQSWGDIVTMFNELFSTPMVTDTAFLLSDSYRDFTPGVGYSSTLWDTLIAMYCIDYPLDTDLDAINAAYDELAIEAPTMYVPYPRSVDSICGNWPFQYRGGQHEIIHGEGAAPVLVVSTTGDPATPYEAGVRLSEQLESATLVSYDGEGHTAYSAYGNACVLHTVDDYLLTGTVPSDDVWCED